MKNFLVFIICLVVFFAILLLVPPIRIFVCSNFNCSAFNYFDALSSLFSGLAFAGLLYTIFQQQEEIKGTQQEMYVQRFENSFFNMLSQHNDMASRFRVERPDLYTQPLNGKEVFLHFQDHFKKILFTKREFKSDLSLSDYATYIDKSYDDLYLGFSTALGGYYRSLYRIFCFLDDSDLNNKFIYSNILRSQLSDDEIVLLFFNGISEKGVRFKYFIEKYSLLDNIPQNQLLDIPLSLYHKTAFKKDELPKFEVRKNN